MATISLKDYHDQLQKWLKQNNTDRVIANSRHILQYYPKNVDTYRYLGQALTMTSQWQAAVKILRRVLGVHPDDYDAHAGLYEAYEELGQHDAALWHLERAFELNPNNADLISTLRQMYREHRGLNLRKIPLTYGAAARQFRASRLFPQAVDTLQDALVRNPDRADLRLLLAQVYWEAQRPVDAGEVALQVLEQLPDCFDANLIMTLLWLDEDRPADATPHLVSMEQVNPYRALEIVSGEVPADDEFMLEELDYQREAAQSVVVDDTAFLGSDFDFGTEEQDSPAETPEDTADASDFFASEIPDDWLDDDLPEPDTDGNTGDQQTGVLSRLTGPLPDLDEADANEDEFDFSEDEEDPFAFMGESGTGVTGMLEGNDEIDEDDPLDWMAQPGADNTDMPDEDTPTEAADNEDPLAWMQQSGTGVTGMLEDDEAEGEQAGTPLEEGGDPLQWMNTGDLPDKGQSGDVDPLAWMNDEDVELADGDSGELFDPAAAMAADNEGYQQGDDVDPLAWLETDHFNEEDAQAVPDIENEDIKDEAPVEDGDDADPLAWMNDEEFANTIEFGEAQTGPLSVEDSEPDTIPDWLAGDDAVLDEMLDVETLTTGDEDADLFAEFDDEDDAWLDDVDGTGDLDAVEDTPDEPAAWLNETDIDAGEDAPTDDDDLAWLDDGETDADEADAPETSDFAWAEDDEADTDSGLNWDDIDEGEFSGDAMTDTSDLSWMEDSNVDTSDLAGTMLFDQDDEDDAHPSDTVFDEDDLADDFDPPTGSLDFDEEDMDEAASDTDAFDTVADDIDDSTNWLQNLESKFEGGGENAEADTDSDLILDVGASDEAFDFGDEDPDTLDFDSPATDEFDFDDPSSDSPATDEFDFGDSSSEAADTDEFAEAEANADIDVDTDWLSNLGAQFDEDSDSAANVNPDTGLLFDVGEFDKDGGEDEDESPAWLADIDEEDDPLGPPTGDTSELLATGSTEEEGEFDISDDADAIADGEMPGWLADIRPDEGTAPLNNQPSADTDQFAEDFDQAMAKFDDEEPEDEALLDWMTTPDDFDDSTTAQEGEAAMSDHYPEDNHEDDEQPDWLDDLNNDEEADPVAEDEQPDWLADLEPGDDKEEPADADFGATMMLDDEDDDLDDDDFAFGATFNDEDDAEPVDEDEQPDWLADLDEPDDDEEEPAGADFGATMMLDDEDDDLDDDDFAFGATFDDADDAEPVDEDEQLDWLADLDEPDDNEEEPAGVDFGATMMLDDEGDDLDDDDFAFGATFDDEEDMDPVDDEQPDWLADLNEPDDNEEEPAGADFGATMMLDDEGDDLDDDDFAFGATFDDADDAEPVDEDEQLDWLADLDEPDEDADIAEPIAEDEQPDWLADIEPDEDETELAFDDDQAFDFETASEQNATGEPFDFEQAADMPEDEEADFAFDEEEPLPEAEPVSDEDIDWLDDETTDEAPVETEPIAEAGAVEDDEDAPDWLTYDPDDPVLQEETPAIEEESDIAPAENAPDWLNAMVPGLDLDYSAEEEQPIESEFVEEVPTSAEHDPAEDPRKDFNWLLELVEDEGQPTVAPVERRRRFRFSQPPRWLRQPAESDVNLDDLPTDSAPIAEEPPWVNDAVEEDEFTFDPALNDIQGTEDDADLPEPPDGNIYGDADSSDLNFEDDDFFFDEDPDFDDEDDLKF